MADDRPRTSFTTKAIVVAVVVVAVWIVLRVTFATVRAAFALAGYLIVAFLAYQFGKFVGRNSGPDDDPTS
jgi:uncharacterized membrane-anchored protein